ncbi:hypothetical protein [Novosphingobium sp. SG707]|uniref:hypothetical protein n=1 Tax=Novosphingobium sp. SG707 TaxID=2586996 RepID=UPI001446CFA7|nr:hypothetical protein [Novosphingobium sp. SG707]NKJ01642.1 hypothetical protein [Novosphingobium sp. SG707]
MNREPAQNAPAVTEVDGFDAHTAIRTQPRNGKLCLYEPSICPTPITKGSGSL